MNTKPNLMDWLKLLAQFKVATLEQLQSICPLEGVDLEHWEQETMMLRKEIPTLDGGMKTVLGLGRKGAEVVATETGKDMTVIPYFTPARFKRSMFTIEHELGITDVGLCASQFCQSEEHTKLIHWETSPQRIGTSVRLITRRGLTTVPLVADAFLGLGIEKTTHWFLLEVDRATINLKRMTTKLAGYREWWQCQGPKHRFGVKNLRVLFLVPNEKRLNALRRVWQDVSGKGGKGFVWFALQETASIKNPRIFTQAVWQTLDSPARKHLFNTVPDRRPEPGACG